MLKHNFKKFSVVLGLLFATSAFAVQPIWSPVSTPASALLGDYHSAQCGQKAPAPYTGSLLLQSKYDQSDASKSTLAKSVDADTQEVQKRVESFMKGLVTYSKSFEKAKSAKNATEALACFDQWLETWSQDGALLHGTANGTGAAVRKWTLAAISASILRTQALSNNAYQLSSVQKDWLKQVAQHVMKEGEPRQQNPASVYFNNHDYWTAWAVASTGMVLDREDFILWADTTLRLAFEQITPSEFGDYAYLPFEVARGSLGADYSNYAFVPLMLLVETMQINGRPLDAEEERKLQLLANFTARITLEPGDIPELKGQLTEYSIPDSPACAEVSAVPAEFWWAASSEGDARYSPSSSLKGRVGFGAGVGSLRSSGNSSKAVKAKAFARHFFKLGARMDNKGEATGNANSGSGSGVSQSLGASLGSSVSQSSSVSSGSSVSQGSGASSGSSTMASATANSGSSTSPDSGAASVKQSQNKVACAPVARTIPLDSAMLSLSQQTVGKHKKSWLIPFLARYPRHEWARRLYKDASGTGTIGNYSQIGGDIRPFYPSIE